MSQAPVLKQDVETLQHLLEQIVTEQAGDEASRLIAQLRQLARERRVGLPGADDRLASRIQQLNEEEIAVAVRALSIYFDLANLSEDLQRVRVLRERELTAGTRPRPESLAAAVASLKQAGMSAAQVHTLLDKLCVDLVFTAHPTEAKRRTTRRIIKQLREELPATHGVGLLPQEQANARERMLSELALLWQIDLMRPQPPTVMQEVERGLFFFDNLWEVAPRLRGELRAALKVQYGEIPANPESQPAFVKFGSWIGGDRDGNPFVTADLTARTLDVLRKAAIERHLAECRRISQLLVMSDRRIAVSPEFQTTMTTTLSRFAGLRAAAESIAEVEVYRRWLKVIETRLSATLASTGATSSESFAYRSAQELLSDVVLIRKSLVQHRGERIADRYIDDWIDQIITFGLHFAALDVRQDSRVHVEVLNEMFRCGGKCPDYAATSEAERQSLLVQGLAVGNEGLQDKLSDMARETLSLFKLLARTIRSQGAERLGGHVISMTHHPSDVLAVLALWQWAWKAIPGDGQRPLAYLPIVPLFETIDDLRRGPDILDQLLSIPQYVEYLRSSGEAEPSQVVMVGYSDSTKDGGYLAASAGLYRAQEKLAEVALKHGIRLVVFHGRGGSLGRGGGPAARAILSLPPDSVNGSLRMTEQGEVLAERYDDANIAFRHLEQVTWATLLVSGKPAETPPPEWTGQLERLAQRSYLRYRELVEEPGFLAYFDQGTPISEIERMPIGSRPSRRRERKSLSDLRAIPWTFAWTQNRHFLPAWFGLGTALVEAVQERNGDWSEFQQMYERWPMFQAIIDNATLALSKADIAIGQRYAELVEDPEIGKRLWSMIAGEFEQSRASVLMIAGQPSLLAGTPWLQQSIQERNPFVDPLNLIQIELIRRLRTAADAGDDASVDRLRHLVRLTIQGVASGLRTTG